MYGRLDAGHHRLLLGPLLLARGERLGRDGGVALFLGGPGLPCQRDGGDDYQ